MAVMDEFKKEREVLKSASLKEKISYYVYYYKWHAIIAIVAVALIVSFIVEVANRKDRALYICMLNVSERPTSNTSLDTVAADTHAAEFAEYAAIDTSQYDLYCDTSMKVDMNSMSEDTINSSQKFMAYLAAAEMDVMVTDADSLQMYAYQEDFSDLREILSSEQLEKYSPYFYYIDMVSLAQWNEYLDQADNLYTDFQLDFPDPRKPENMEEPVPVGIYLPELDKLTEHFYFQSDEIVASVFVNTQKLETSLQYIDFLME